MKRIKATAVLAAVLAALAGCTSTGAADGSSSPSVDPDELTVSTVKWEGGTGNPELVFDKPLRVSEPTIGVIDAGDGDIIAMGQLVTFDSLVVDGETGAVEASTFGGDTPDQLILSANTANTTMLTAMRSARVGARFLYVTPGIQTAAGTSPNTSGETTAAAAKVIAISIRSVTDLPTEARGRARTPDRALPVVTFGADGLPTLKAPKGDPGTELITDVLIEGTGPLVSEGQTLAVKYQGWLWDGTVFERSWGDADPVVFNLNDVISGWSQGVVGKKVGSRVLMVIPPGLAYGGSGQDSIPPDSTLIFLVDILAAY